MEISEDALMRASAMGNVETFPIDHPHPDTGVRREYLFGRSLAQVLPQTKGDRIVKTAGFKGVGNELMDKIKADMQNVEKLSYNQNLMENK